MLDIDRVAEFLAGSVKAMVRAETESLRVSLADAVAAGDMLAQRIKELEDHRPADGRDGAPGRDGIDGKDGQPGRDGRDAAPGKDGLDGKDGANGKDGLGFDDLSVDFDGERGLVLRFSRGDQVKEFPLRLPVPIDRGVWKEASSYERGDLVTWAGSVWIAQKDAPEGKPEQTADWRLAVKRGRDAKPQVKP